MKVQYLSYYLKENTPNYGGIEGTIKISNSRSISCGDSSNNFNLELPNHIGTHIDFPKHFFDDGKTINDYSPDFWIFNSIGFVCGEINNLPNLIKDIPETIELLIIKTGFGKERNKKIYWANQPVISSKFAKILRLKFPKLRVFGFDMISLTSQLDKNEGKLAHQKFLGEYEILVLEDMNLLNLITTPKQVIISPLQIDKANGSQCNVLAIVK